MNSSLDEFVWMSKISRCNESKTLDEKIKQLNSSCHETLDDSMTKKRLSNTSYPTSSLSRKTMDLVRKARALHSTSASSNENINTSQLNFKLEQPTFTVSDEATKTYKKSTFFNNLVDSEEMSPFNLDEAQTIQFKTKSTSFQNNASFTKLSSWIEEIDKALCLFVLRRVPAYWTDLLVKVKASGNDQFSLKLLQKIIAVCPLYSLHFIKNEKENREEIVVKIINEDNSEFNNSLLTNLKIKLRRRVFEEHLEKKIIALGLDIDRNDNWIDKLPLAELPLNFKSQENNKKACETMEQIKQQREAFDTTVRKSSSVLSQLRARGVISPKTINQSSSSELASRLKERLLKEIKEKEISLNLESIDKTTQKAQVCYDSNTLTEISETIDGYYNIRGVKNMFLIKVIEYLGKNFPRPFSPPELIQMIEEITTKAAVVFILVDNKSGKLLRKIKETTGAELRELLK